ncbi:MAG TPA: hypothetical protein VKQ36_10735 [Ktedonobacterales bacterium]|nr:hypothetical protein [Ktedonobacterales bacterium]
MLDDLTDLHEFHEKKTMRNQSQTPDGKSAAHGEPTAAPGVDVEAREWVSPGVSLRKRWLTGVGVALVALLFFWLAIHEGASALVSTLIGVVFIAGFIGYLWVAAPTPFVLRLDAQGITRTERNGEPVAIPWDQIARVKEEVFKSGVTVSLSVYKRVGARGVHRAFIIYRDDIPHFSEFASAFAAALRAETPWLRETVHE